MTVELASSLECAGIRMYNRLWSLGHVIARTRVVVTIVVCFFVATGLALIAAISMLLGGQTAPSLRGWGLGRLLAFYLIAGCVSSALIGLGLAVLPTRRLTSAFLGAVLGAGLYLVYLWLDPNHSLNSPGHLPGIVLTALALGVPGGLILHSVMRGMDAHIGS